MREGKSKGEKQSREEEYESMLNGLPNDYLEISIIQNFLEEVSRFMQRIVEQGQKNKQRIKAVNNLDLDLNSTKTEKLFN